MFIHHLPEAAGVRVGWNAFKHDADGAIGQRPVNDIGVAGDPADIGGAPENLALAVIKNVLVRQGRPHHVAAGGVQHPLRFSGRAGGIKNEQRVLGVHFLGFAIG